MCEATPRGRYNDEDEDCANRLKTYQAIDYFIKLGYKTYHVWECEFEHMKKRDANMREFCDKLELYPDTRYRVSEAQILREIKSGDWFGLVQVDLHTPEKLKSKYAEFQPIAKHAMISRDDIGEHMREFCEKNDLLKRPVRTLISSYYAEKILLATPLLQWYLNQGLVVTKVYQTVQYKPSTCFKQFGDEVMSARRTGDADPSKKIIGDMCKLLGELSLGDVI